jgi:hypothetical protein
MMMRRRLLTCLSVSILRTQPHVTLYLDPDSASMLDQVLADPPGSALCPQQRAAKRASAVTSCDPVS